MPRSNNAALEKRERGFHGVCVKSPCAYSREWLIVWCFSTGNLTKDVRINHGFIRQDNLNMIAYVRFDDILRTVFPFASSSTDQPQISIALANPDNNLLPGANAALAWFAANISFVNLNLAVQSFSRAEPLAWPCGCDGRDTTPCLITDP